jgi:hypothetical protein
VLYTESSPRTLALKGYQISAGKAHKLTVVAGFDWRTVSMYGIWPL